jgi:hypothetical protein
MGKLTKPYRLIWKTNTKEILNDYRTNYGTSVTEYPEVSPNSYYEADTLQSVLTKITTEGLVPLTPPDPRK